MPKAAMRFMFWLVVAMSGSSLAHAYTRAYVVNNTGQAAYTLHVKLAHPAAQNSAGSGYSQADFGMVQLSSDGTTIVFSNPLNAFGIAAGQTVWIGWSDLDTTLPADIVSYYWTDAAGNMVGGMQYPSPDNNGDPSLQTDMQNILQNGTGSGGDPALGTTTTQTDPTTTTTTTTTTSTDLLPPDTQGNQPGSNQQLTTNPNDPSFTGNDSLVTPEPGSALLLMGALVLGAWVRRRSLIRR
ncbi:MAG TPA: PEP-CTERM sorting domain-containing protein [Candidatus Limnocylindrales bacterium]|nr:PEP-CTERM sorting domain-containing protein [Candidatus Limnocylindrales bacterium]